MDNPKNIIILCIAYVSILIIFVFFIFMDTKNTYPVFHQRGDSYLYEDSVRVQLPDSVTFDTADPSIRHVWHDGYKYTLRDEMIIEKPEL